MRTIAKTIGCIAALLSTGTALAATLGFEALGTGNYPTVSLKGYEFKPTNSNTLSIVATGNRKAISPRWGDTMTLKPVGNAGFSLQRLVYTGYWDNVSSRVDVTGEKLDGTRVTSSFTYSAGTWKTHTLDWTGLRRVSFFTPKGRVILDNLVVFETPLDDAPLVDFEELSHGRYNGIQSQGFRFTPTNEPTVDVVDDGQTISLSHLRGDPLLMRRTDSSPFSLTTVDYRGRWKGSTGQLDIIGIQTDGSRLSKSLAFDGLTWQTLELGWSDLASVQFLTPRGRAKIDNLDTTPAEPPPVTGCQPTAAEQVMLDLVNQARATARQCGTTQYAATTPVTWNCKLRDAATRHSEDMANNDFFSHTGSDGSTMRERVTDTGYLWQTIGENIAAGYPSEQAVMTGWLASPGHCANIMRASYTEMGSSKIEANQTTYGIYWTQVFAAPR